MVRHTMRGLRNKSLFDRIIGTNPYFESGKTLAKRPSDQLDQSSVNCLNGFHAIQCGGPSDDDSTRTLEFIEFTFERLRIRDGYEQVPVSRQVAASFAEQSANWEDFISSLARENEPLELSSGVTAEFQAS